MAERYRKRWKVEILPEPQKVLCEVCRDSVGAAVAGPRASYLCLGCVRGALGALFAAAVPSAAPEA